METDVQAPLPKRNRTDLALYQPAGDPYDDGYGDGSGPGPIRTSSLSEPTMKLAGHGGSVYCLAYDPAGEVLCTGSFDTTCLLWEAGGSCRNLNVLRGHKNAVLDVGFSADSGRIVTASADRTVAYWDAMTGERIRRFQGHGGIVNAVAAARDPASGPLLVSGSDDRTARIWDGRSRTPAAVLEDEFQVTAVELSADSTVAYTGGIDNCITAWDWRAGRRSMKMAGHTDTVTCLALDPAGTHLLSNSMDGTLRSWDVRPYVEGNRLDRTFVGGTHNAEKGLLNCAWSADGTMVTGGSADRVVHIWDVPTCEGLYALGGHQGCVNAATFHPSENVIASASSDKAVYVGELSH